MSVNDMWLALENQETSGHWELLNGWRRSYELTLQHIGQVKDYRENLEAAWPPQKSPASAAYLAHLDELIIHLQNTYNAAVKNYGVFSSATLAISSARTNLEEIVNEYAINQGKLEAAFENGRAPTGRSDGPSRRPVVGTPVTDDRQLQLQNQARTIMYGLSSELSQAGTQLAKPPPYNPRMSVTDNKVVSGDGGFSPPRIPAVAAFDPYDASSSENMPSRSGKSLNSNAGTVGSSVPDRQPGPILGGIDPPVLSSPSVLPAPSPGGGPMPGGTPIILPRSGAVSVSINPGRTRDLSVDGFARSGRGVVPISGTRPTPPGGIIGGAPGARLGQPPGGLRTPQQVSPVGGLISPGSNADSPATRRTSALGHPVAPLVGRALSDEGGRDGTKRWDPYNPWEAAEGVSPIVRPPAEQRIDPGPAIGLH